MTGVQSLPIAQIDATDRLRPVDPDYVKVLSMSLEQIGLQEPIVVRPGRKGGWQLLAGAHRLASAIALGWTDIDAVVRDDLDDAQARLVEIDENLMRRELSALDRAIFLAERKKVWVELHPELGRGGDRKSAEFYSENQTANLAVWSDIAERVGLSYRSIARACQLVEKLDPRAIEAIRLTRVANNQAQLQSLARLPASEQVELATRWAAEPPTRGGANAVEKAADAPATPHNDQMVIKLIKAWDGAGRRERRRFLVQALRVPADRALIAEELQRAIDGGSEGDE